MSGSSEKFANDAAQEDSTQSAADKLNSDHHRSSRRKPAKTRKVAADVNDIAETAEYDDYLRGGIPNVLLEGLGFAESQHSGSNSPHSSIPDDIDEHVTADDHDSSISTASPVSSPYRRLHVSRGSNGTAARPIPFNVTPPLTTSQPASAPRRRGRPPANSNRTQPPAVRSPAPETPVAKVTNIPADKLLPVTQHNVGPVLEKMLAATQSMGMLLASLKDDLRRTSLPFVPTGDQQRKRHEAASKLWRAFIAYKKSFEDIEKYTKTTGNQTLPSTASVPPSIIPTNFPAGKPSTAASVPAQEPQSKMPARAARKQSNPKAVAETVIVVNLSDLSSESDEEQQPAEKKLRIYDVSAAAEIDGVDKLKSSCTSTAAVQRVEIGAEKSIRSVEGEGSNSTSSTDSGSTTSSVTKTQVFSTLRFEPLFDVNPVNNADN